MLLRVLHIFGGFHHTAEGYNEANIASDSNFLAVRTGAAASLMYHAVSGNGVATFDSTNYVCDVISFARDTWYKFAVQFGALSSNVAKLRSGHDPSTGIEWATAVNYDGAFFVHLLKLAA